MIYVTGDIHGSNDIQRLSKDNFPESKSLSKKDYVIICGDFGLIWSGSEKEEYWLNWLNRQPFTTLFLDGNHENFDMLNRYPIEYWHEGKVHFINESVIHLMRGQVFNIDGKTFFTFGGATSIDKIYREENISWWKEEMPSVKELEEGLKNLSINNLKVDYILTHCCSSNTLEYVSICCGFDGRYELDTLNKYFNIIEKEIKFQHWYFGHYHEDVRNIVSKQSLLYKEIVRIV